MKTRLKLNPIRPLARKPGRPLAFMAKLSAEQKETLFTWLTKDGGVTYAKAKERILRQWGIKASSDALCSFWQRYCQPRLLQPGPDPATKVVLELVIQVRAKERET
jgi:hypothetical protein